jgi:predicted transcriptional regulator
MPGKVDPSDLSRRERQVLDIVLRLSRATARDIERELPNAPTYSAVRSILRILVNKRLLRKKRRLARDWFYPTVHPATARLEIIRGFVRNFFEGSAVQAASALLGHKSVKLSKDEAGKLIELIEEARRR